jgi:restriction system protein
VPFPKQAEIEVPLLQALVELGGEGRPRDIYPLVAKRFPQLTPEEQEERLENYPSTRKWSNLVQWIRQRLVDLGQVDGSQRGIWKITAAGRARLSENGVAPVTATSPDYISGAPITALPATSLRDFVNANMQEIRTGLSLNFKFSPPSL